MKKNKRLAEERTVVVEKTDSSYANALSEVKKVSGFESALPIKANLVGNAVEYVFLVSDTIKHCEDELFQMRVEFELGHR